MLDRNSRFHRHSKRKDHTIHRAVGDGWENLGLTDDKAGLGSKPTNRLQDSNRMKVDREGKIHPADCPACYCQFDRGNLLADFLA